ncbi:hypothetical protein Tco_0777469 [Tanacetum coccineum]
MFMICIKGHISDLIEQTNVWESEKLLAFLPRVLCYGYSLVVMQLLLDAGQFLEFWLLILGIGYSLKDKNEAKTDKIEHEIGKSIKSQQVKDEAENEEILNGPTRTRVNGPGPFPGQILTAVGVDANNRIYPLAYTIVEAESKAFWYSFNPIINLDCPQGLIQAIASVFPSAEHRFYVKHIHENMKSEFKGGVYKDMLGNAARATIVVEFNKNMVSRPPKNRKKSVDELASQSCSLGKLSWKGKSSQGARQAAGARNVFSQDVVTSQQSQAPRQVVGARNASGQANGSSQQKKGPRQGVGARNASSQTAGSSQPSVAPSQASQGPSQHGAGPTQASQGPKKGFQAPIPTPYYGPQRLTKKSSSRQPSETTILF